MACTVCLRELMKYKTNTTLQTYVVFQKMQRVRYFINITNEENSLIQGVHSFSKNLGATSKFQASESLQTTRYIPRAHKYLASPQKIFQPERPGVHNLYTPALHRNKHGNVKIIHLLCQQMLLYFTHKVYCSIRFSKWSIQAPNLLQVAGANFLHTSGSSPLKNEQAILSRTASIPISPVRACKNDLNYLCSTIKTQPA